MAYIVKRDNKKLASFKEESEALTYLQKIQPFSSSHAITYEGYKIEKENSDKKQEQKKLFLEDIKKRGTITEKEILLIKRRLNEGTYKDVDLMDFYDLNLTKEQSQKGLVWLKNKGWGITGKERKDSPYGYREEEALRTFKGIKLNGFTNISTYGEFKNYVPLYRVEGDTNFEYYVQGGKVNITG
jgi:hypothetical protein